MKVFLFNGPPRCGKDTSAIRTINVFSRPDMILLDRFSMPCKRAFAGMMDATCIDRFGNVEPYESTKTDVIPSLGISYRQWQIDFSEYYMKPKYGIDIFGRLFCQRNETLFGAKAIVVPDSGFAEEVSPVVDQFGMKNVLLLRIHRPGFDFTGDSRSYLPDGLVDKTLDVQNDGTIQQFNTKLDQIVGDFLHG